VQQWFNLSDPGLEDALYDSPALRRFVGVDLGMAAAPDETTILRFRHLLEEHDLGGEMLDEVNRHLADKGNIGCFLASYRVLRASCFDVQPSMSASACYCRPKI
jgi:IS5 family transposase